MATEKLNALQVRNAGPGKYFDGGGLFLDVQARGQRYWRMKYRFGGVERLLALGVYPEVSLAEARQHHEQARACLRDGKDPMAVRQAAEREAAARVGNKFEAVCREWVKVKGAQWSSVHRQAILEQLERDAFPRLGRIPVAELLPMDILETIRVVEARGAVDSAGRLLRRITRALNYAVATNRLVSNPARDLRDALMTPARGRHAALPFEDVGKFLVALETHPGNLETRIALEMIVHTFVRSQEMRLARWSEFDADAWDPDLRGRKYWLIPGGGANEDAQGSCGTAFSARSQIAAAVVPADRARRILVPASVRRRSGHVEVGAAQGDGPYRVYRGDRPWVPRLGIH